MKLKIILFISLFFLNTNFLFSQNIDSLRLLLQSKNNSKELIFYKIGHTYLSQFNLDSAIIYLHKAQEISKDPNIETKTQQDLGLLFFYKNDFKNSLFYFKNALNTAQKINNDSACAKIYSNIGVIYDYLGVYDFAVENYLNALKIFDKLNDDFSKSKIYNNLGIIYQVRGYIDTSLNYYNKALKIKKTTNAAAYDIASTFVNIGSAYEDNSQFQLALNNYYKALLIYENENNPKHLATCYSNIAGIYYYTNKLDSSMLLLNKALVINKKFNLSSGISSNLLLKGKICEKQNKLDSAIFYLNIALDTASKINYIDKKIEILSELSTLYANKKNYSLAFELQKELIQTKDSLNNQQLNEKIETLKIVYETQKKEKQITYLQKNISKNKLLLSAVVLIFSLLLIIFILFYKQKLTKEKYKVNEFNQKLLRAQMNPHFIFNALTSIQSYMFDNDSKNAAIYLSSFSKLTRSILNNSRNELITLEEEIQTIENYLKIQQLRYEKKFNYSLKVDPIIETDLYLIPPMLTQPFIENSIVHGFKNISYPGMIEINFIEKKDAILISITDNGTGLKKKSNSEHKSHATTITQERLKIINRKKKEEITFKIFDLKETDKKSGIKIVFSVPIIIKQN